eukprot:TRINITY_DN17233_c0_g1_i1.p1 TRINITY_DN17233_c0_g1~~TRINITY_DN17233_c0_g1_i1.p1  ORF type:complete len:361 (-),score=104.51 TRINITY_DN17233_c0_g1_i1:86-1117(-)
MVFRVVFFSTQPYDKDSFEQALKRWQGVQLEFTFHAEKLTEATASLANGFDAVCIFVNDTCNAAVLAQLKSYGIKLVLLRCAGFNNVDQIAAAAVNIKVMRVPRYSPHAVAEHAATLMMTLTRNMHRTVPRVKSFNFQLQGLLGFDIAAKTVGVVGTGAIGKISAQIMKGFGARVVAFDPFPSHSWAQKVGVEYMSFEELCKVADVITLHVPLTKDNHYLISAKSLKHMKDGVMIINTSRGGLVNTKDVINALRVGKVGYLGIDVYENETPYFFKDHSGKHLEDPVFQELLSFPNVVCSAHQAFFTQQAMQAIAGTTLTNVQSFVDGKATGNPNEVAMPKAKL